jgi:hypothetical protein
LHARQLCSVVLPARAYCQPDWTHNTLSEKFAPVRGGGDEAERVVLTKANEFCTQQGRAFVAAMMGQSGNMANPYGPTGYTVTFKCLLPNDPAVARYQVQQAPNIIVEHH